MKKYILASLLLGFIGISRADVSQKVVELHINKDADFKETKTKYRKAPLKVDRHFVCSAGFIDDHGDILTAKHCVDGATSVEVATYDNQTYKATVLATSLFQDLALIHIDKINTPYFDIAPVVQRGDYISTLGSPLAVTGTQSWGQVAKIDGDLLFMDQSVLPGNSGGVVFNNREHLVGVAVSVAIVGFGVTHLAQAQSLDSVVYFLRENRRLLDQSAPLRIFRAFFQ